MTENADLTIDETTSRDELAARAATRISELARDHGWLFNPSQLTEMTSNVVGATTDIVRGLRHIAVPPSEDEMRAAIDALAVATLLATLGHTLPPPASN